MRISRLLLIGLVTALGAAAAQAASITAEQAGDHIGQTATVCSIVASAHYAARSRSRPTFLNLDRPYPARIFTAVIWGPNRPKFGELEVTLMGKRICVTGPIGSYRGTPEIILRNPSQLTR